MRKRLESAHRTATSSSPDQRAGSSLVQPEGTFAGVVDVLGFLFLVVGDVFRAFELRRLRQR